MTKKIAAPKDKTLNKDMRDKLKAFTITNVKCPAEKAALDTAYAVAKTFVLSAVVAVYPVKDMKVLERYGAATADTCIRFGGRYDHESVFHFNDAVEAPLVPRHTGCGDRGYVWSKEAKDALNAYVLARQAHAKALQAKRDDYIRLIDGSRTFNDVVGVWPAAEQLRPKIIPATVEQRALAVLSEDAIARIKADNAGA
jgi:hypothetical protein